MIPLEEALGWTRWLAMVAVLLHTLELLSLRAVFQRGGPWSGGSREENGAFLLLQGLRLPVALASLAMENPLWLSFLAFTNLLVSLRFRGSFNGGSDGMTFTVLASLALAAFFPGEERMRTLALSVIAANALLSYFVPGVLKLRNPRWRTGEELTRFVLHSPYDAPATLRTAMGNPPLARAAAWGVLAFECAFPLALLVPALCPPLLAIGLLFHLGNAWAFGLNRFVFAWIAAYPALVWVAKSIA